MMDAQTDTIHEQNRNPFISRLIKFQIIIAVIIVIVSIIIGIQIPALLKEKTRLEQEIKETNKKLEQAKSVLFAINPILEKYGFLEELTVDTLNSDLVKQSFEANQQIQLILARAYRTRQLPVWYYSKDVNVDPVRVRNSLEEFGFNVVPQDPQRPDLPTNNIAFGKNVDPEDAKLVAYTLLRAGIEIKAICKSKTDSRDSIIQVLSDNRLLSKPAMTVEQIRNKRTFIDCPDNFTDWPQE